MVVHTITSYNSTQEKVLAECNVAVYLPNHQSTKFNSPSILLVTTSVSIICVHCVTQSCCQHIFALPCTQCSERETLGHHGTLFLGVLSTSSSQERCATSSAVTYTYSTGTYMYIYTSTYKNMPLPCWCTCVYIYTCVDVLCIVYVHVHVCISTRTGCFGFTYTSS